MNDYYVEILIKRDVEKEKKKIQLIVLAIITTTFVLGSVTIYSIFFLMFVMSLLAYYFLARNYSIEFEYFYMNGELTISKIINKSRRKKVLELHDELIKAIAPVNSAEINAYNNLEKEDCTANVPSIIPYAIIYMDKEVKRVDIQMNDELYKEFKRNMPYKIKNC